MRKLLILSLGLLFVGSVAWAGSGVVGSVHDFSAGSGNNVTSSETQVCKFCHAPHNNALNLVGAPLWNHDTTLTATFNTYSSDTFDATDIADIGAGDNSSWLCMSCHDGTVGIGNLQNGEDITVTDSGGILDTDGSFLGSASQNMGTDLTNDHPINFGASPPADADITIGVNYPLNNAGEFHCSTCHDPHDGTATSTYGKLLRGDPVDSAICKDCHTDK